MWKQEKGYQSFEEEAEAMCDIVIYSEIYVFDIFPISGTKFLKS